MSAKLDAAAFDAFAEAIRDKLAPSNSPQEDLVWHVAAAALDHLGIKHPPVEPYLSDDW